MEHSDDESELKTNSEKHLIWKQTLDIIKKRDTVMYHAFFILNAANVIVL